jgi:hypothetical protein
VDFQDYHGEWTVWMKETFDVARGLERQGLPWLARQVGIRLLNAVNVAGAHVEFLYVSPDQRVMYDFRACDLRTAEPEVITGTNQPEAPITWTVTAALALKSWLGSNRTFLCTAAPDAATWRQALEAEVRAQVPERVVHRTSAELRTAYARPGARARKRQAREDRRIDVPAAEGVVIAKPDAKGPNVGPARLLTTVPAPQVVVALSVVSLRLARGSDENAVDVDVVKDHHPGEVRRDVRALVEVDADRVDC